MAQTPRSVLAARRGRPEQAAGPGARRVLLAFLELQVPMALGALVCLLVVGLIPPSSAAAAVYYPGSYLYAVGDMLFLTAPVVAWLLVRGRGRRRGLEMAAAMVAPVAAVVVLGQAAGYASLAWLPVAVYPAMALGMLAYVLGRRDGAAGAPAA